MRNKGKNECLQQIDHPCGYEPSGLQEYYAIEGSTSSPGWWSVFVSLAALHGHKVEYKR